MSEFDHLVLATPDLAATVDLVARSTGSTLVAGGRHIDIGTRNFLLGLGAGGYLEIIGPDPDQPTPDRPRPFGIDTLTEPRLTTWAVRVTNIDTAVAYARTNGFDPGDAEAMSRATPDGRTLHWRLTRARDSGSVGVVPFLIDWGTTEHPATELPQAKLESLLAVHPDPAAISRDLTAVAADIEVRSGTRIALIATIAGSAGTITLI